MRPICVINSCGLRHSGVTAAADISFHKFPKNEEARERWLRSVIKGTHLSKMDAMHLRERIESKGCKRVHVCSRHFQADMYWSSVTIVRSLKRSATPTLFGIHARAFIPEFGYGISTPRNDVTSKEETTTTAITVIACSQETNIATLLKGEGSRINNERAGEAPLKKKKKMHVDIQFVGEPSVCNPSTSEEGEINLNAQGLEASVMPTAFQSDNQLVNEPPAMTSTYESDNHFVNEDNLSNAFPDPSQCLATVKEEATDLIESGYTGQDSVNDESAMGDSEYDDGANGLVSVKEEPDLTDSEGGRETLPKDVEVGMDVEEEAGCSYDSFMYNGGPLSSDEGTSFSLDASSSGLSPPKRKRTELTVSAKLDLIDRYRRLDVKSRRQAAALLNVSHGFLNQVLKKEADLRGGVPTKIRNRCGKDKEIEDGLLRWLREASVVGGAPMSGALLCQKAEEIAARLGKADFKATDGWLNRWKKRNSLLMPRKKRPEGEAGETLDDVLSSYPPSCVYCAAPVPLCFRLLPGDKASDATRQRLTVLLCCSLTGEREPLVVIGSEGAPRCFNGVKAFPVAYRGANRACLTRAIWNEWLQRWNLRLRSEMRRVLLLVADCPALASFAKLSHLTVRHMDPHTAPNTAGMLPIELGVAKAAKGFFRRALHQRLLDLLEDCSDAMSAGEVVRKVTLLDALYLLSTAWRKVNGATIMQCWHDAGFQAACADPEGVHDPKPPPGLNTEDFHVWVSVDDNLLAAVEEDGAATLGAQEEEVEEGGSGNPAIPTPSKSVMRVALQLLRIGLERRGFENLEAFCLLEEDVRDCLRNEPDA